MLYITLRDSDQHFQIRSSKPKKAIAKIANCKTRNIKKLGADYGIKAYAVRGQFFEVKYK